MSSSGNVIKLDVGGVSYKTSRDALVSCPESMLAAMFKVDDDNLPPAPLTDEGRYFIDGDGHLFKHVLSYLRTKTLVLPDDWDVSQCRLLRAEADFYQIEALVKEIDKEIQRRRAGEEKQSQKEPEFMDLTVKERKSTFEDVRIDFMGIVKTIPYQTRYTYSDWELFAKYDTLKKMDLLDDEAPVPAGKYTMVYPKSDPTKKINQMGFLECKKSVLKEQTLIDHLANDELVPDVVRYIKYKFFKCDDTMVLEMKNNTSKPLLG